MNITDRLTLVNCKMIYKQNLLQEVQRNIHHSGKQSFKQMFFSVFNENCEKRYQQFFEC